MKVERTVKALAANGMPAVYAPTKEEAVQVVESMMKPGDVISCGGSATLKESGVRALMLSGKYNFLDREAMDPDEVYQKTFSADVFLTSANAITEEGELYCHCPCEDHCRPAQFHAPEYVHPLHGAGPLCRLQRRHDRRVQGPETHVLPLCGHRLPAHPPHPCGAGG